MRIGFFTDTYTPQINGVVTSIRLFKNALEARGHEVHVFAPRPVQDDDCDATTRFRSMPFLLQPEMRVASPMSMKALHKVEEANFDIIHSHDPFAIGLFGLTMARRKQVPYVHTYHTLYPEYVHYVWDARWTKRIAESLSREFCDACDTIIAPSTKISRHLHDWGVKTPVEILPTGIDLSHYGATDSTGAKDLRDRLGLREDAKIALFVGRLAKEKSIDRLIEAISCISNDDIHLVLVGGGPIRTDLTHLANTLKVADRVHFTGYLPPSEVKHAYAMADVFAFASLTETQGLVIGEAMAAGLPVVAVQDDAVGDFVHSGESGYLVPDRPQEMAEAIVGLLQDPDRRQAFSENSRNIAQDLSISIQAQRLEELYVQLIEGHTPRRYLPHDLQVRVRRLGARIPSAVRRTRAVSQHFL